MKKIMIGCLVLLVVLLYDVMRPIENSELQKEYIFIIASYHEGDMCGQPQMDAVIEAINQNNVNEFVFKKYFLDTRKREYALVQKDVEEIKKEIEFFKPKFVITIDDPALEYFYRTVLAYDDMFLVFTGVNKAIEKYNESFPFLDENGIATKNITGVYEYLFMKEQLALLEEILQRDVKKIAIMNSTDVVGMILMDQIYEELKDTKYNNKIIFFPIDTKEDLLSNAKEIQNNSEIDAWIPVMMSIQDPNTNEFLTMNKLAPLAIQLIQKPDLSLNMSFTELGFYGGVSIDFYQSGYDAGLIVAALYKGENIKNIPIKNAKHSILALNFKRIQQLNLYLPKNVLDKVDVFIY